MPKLPIFSFYIIVPMSQKILYISQEIFPYLDESVIANISRYLPQAIQDRGNEIRVFMPKYGNINERRNQLHEVIRLSGLNLIIDETDHSLVIKVASIQSARIQVYFIDNEDFFENREIFTDEKGVEYNDNDERSIFFVRGVLETIKKLRWVPDVIHCHGWFTALCPLYIKCGYADDPCFKDARVVYSVYDESFQNTFNSNFAEKLRFEGIGDPEVRKINEMGIIDYHKLTRLAVDFSDGIVQGSEKIDPKIEQYIREKQLIFLPYEADMEKSAAAIDALYENICR